MMVVGDVFKLTLTLAVLLDLTTWGTAQTDFKLRRVTKQSTEDGTTTTLTVHYDGSTKPDVFFLEFDDEAWQNVYHPVEHQLGVVEVTRDVTDRWPFVGLVFHLPPYFFRLAINLRSSALEEDIPDVEMTLPEKITYPAGQDVDFTFTCKSAYFSAWNTIVTNPSEGSPSDLTRYSQIGLVTRNYSSYPVEIVTSSEEEPERSYQLRLKTRGQPEGVIRFFTFSNNPDGKHLVWRLTTGRIVPFYQNTHNAPYSADFAAFITQSYDYHGGQVDYETVECQRGSWERCEVRCPAFGRHVTSVQISQVMHGGQQHVVHEVTESEDGLILDAVFYIYEKASYADGLTEFRCTARSGTTEITMTVNLNMVG